VFFGAFDLGFAGRFFVTCCVVSPASVSDECTSREFNV
jgi:hypothetical protein